MDRVLEPHATDYKDVALKVIMIMPTLLLQKPTFKSTGKEHSPVLVKMPEKVEAG